MGNGGARPQGRVKAPPSGHPESRLPIDAQAGKRSEQTRMNLP